MSSRRLLLLIIACIVALAICAKETWPASGLHLHAIITGTAHVTMNGNGMSGSYSASGLSVESSLGHASLHGHGNGQRVGNCATFTAVGTLRLPAGTLRLRLASPGRACLRLSTSYDTMMAISAKVAVVGGSGYFSGRSGILTLNGDFNPGSDHFSIALDGQLVKKH